MAVSVVNQNSAAVDRDAESQSVSAVVDHWQPESEFAAAINPPGATLGATAGRQIVIVGAGPVGMRLVQELFSVEYSFLDQALETINDEFGTWELRPFEQKKSCSTCVAK